MDLCNLFLLLFALSSITLQLAYGSCPSGWTRHESSCYHFSHDTESAIVANLACQQLGGTLVEIESVSENTFIAGAIKNKQGNYWWIGLDDLKEESIWVWMGSKSPASYYNWRSGEPNNVGQDENCVVMDKGKEQWVDVACHAFYRYICETNDTETEIVG